MLLPNVAAKNIVISLEICRHLKYWHFVGDLRLEFHFLSVIELKEEVGRQAAVKS